MGEIMRKFIALLISTIIVLNGCAGRTTQPNVKVESENEAESEYESEYESDEYTSLNDEGSAEEYANSFTVLADEKLSAFTEDIIYSEIVDALDSDEYFVENVSTVYLSKEYIEELQYNSQSNIYFGYTLAELDEAFQGEKYVFTLGDDNTTTVKKMEIIEEKSYFDIIKNVAIGTGVILICVTVSVVTAGSAPAISVIFAASAKSATTFALSSAALGGVSAGIVTGIQTGNFDEALDAALYAASEGFKWGAITGALQGGINEAIALKGATLNGLTMNEAAAIQRESGYPLDVIKQFKNMDQYEICKKAGLTPKMINGKTALIRDIDLDYVDELTGLTNRELMQSGRAPFAPNGKKYQLHHIGQKNDSTLAVLTQEEHMSGGNDLIWHELGEGYESQIDRSLFDKIRREFWKYYVSLF